MKAEETRGAELSKGTNQQTREHLHSDEHHRSEALEPFLLGWLHFYLIYAALQKPSSLNEPVSTTWSQWEGKICCGNFHWWTISVIVFINDTIFHNENEVITKLKLQSNWPFINEWKQDGWMEDGWMEDGWMMDGLKWKELNCETFFLDVYIHWPALVLCPDPLKQPQPPQAGTAGTRHDGSMTSSTAALTLMLLCSRVNLPHWPLTFSQFVSHQTNPCFCFFVMLTTPNWAPDAP